MNSLSTSDCILALIFSGFIGAIGFMVAYIPTVYQTPDGVCSRVEQAFGREDYSCSRLPPRFDVVIVKW
jgi:hypothetical protein